MHRPVHSCFVCTYVGYNYSDDLSDIRTYVLEMLFCNIKRKRVHLSLCSSCTSRLIFSAISRFYPSSWPVSKILLHHYRGYQHGRLHLGNSMIVTDYRGSWSTIMIMIVFFTIMIVRSRLFKLMH